MPNYDAPAEARTPDLVRGAEEADGVSALRRHRKPEREGGSASMHLAAVKKGSQAGSLVW